ncbi:putative MFS family arabinose efflux permease [Mucilaginibacter gracilis]|uniref:Putative MFS family arabinose efflux permease n=1 Tax=Mucilaginibacter gracilis TaxID=423350 RepID=A0A495J2X7_9SPHI|nr:MFS transporter [Mucilaginibacter gracilis]RKR83031.1 putative MFS family arabinose efflux permease [Mucilaginibacter gracilis]
MILQLYKNAYTGLSRNSWYLCLVMFINRSGTMVIPFVTIYCTQQLHFTITQAGSIVGIFGLGAITGAFIGGKITDKWGFYDLQIFALFTGGLFFILLGFQTTFINMAAGTFLLSICNESFRPANSTAVAHYSNDSNKTRSYSLNRLAVNLGWAFGSAIGGFLASFNFHLLFWVDGCTNIMAAVILLILIPRVKTARPVKPSGESAKALSAYSDKVYLFFLLIVVLFATCFFQLFTMQPVFYKVYWHINVRVIGFLMSLNGIIIAFTEMVIIHRLEGRRHPLQYIPIGILLVGSGFVMLNILPASTWSALVVVILITYGEIMAMPFMNSFWIARTTPYNRGQYAALYTIAWSVAQSLGPFIGSRLISTYGFAVCWWLLAGVCLVATLGVVGLYKAKYSSVNVSGVMTDSL